MKLDDLLSEYSDKAAEQSRERGATPRPHAQPKQRGWKEPRIMRGDPASIKPIEDRRELYERLMHLAPEVRIGSLTGGKAKRNKKEKNNG